jgi:hypothetical protein
MVNTSDRPLAVDGVRLDTLAWNVLTINRATAARRSSDYSLPNGDGALPSVNDPLEPINFGLELWLRGTDVDGAVPVAGSRDTLRANLDEVLHLFGTRHRLIEVTEQVNATETRRALAKVVDSIAPDIATAGGSGTFTVGLVIPAGVWEDATASDWAGVAGTASGVDQKVTTLQGGTERVNDAIFLVKGPANAPQIVDPNTGMAVQLQTNLSSTQFWRFNSATWASRYGTGLTLGSLDTAGTDGSAATDATGPSRAYGLPLVPIREGGFRKVTVELNAGGITSASQLSVRARRKYAG